MIYEWSDILSGKSNTVWVRKINELQRKTQAPVGLVLGSVLSAISTAVQPLFDVERPTGQIGPVSLYLLMAAKSGERKTTVDDAVMGAVWEFDKRQREVHDEGIRKWEEDYEIWSGKRRVLKKASADAYKKFIVKGGDNSGNIDSALREHIRYEPKPPRLFRCLYGDVTIEALFNNLHMNYPVAALISNEGADLFKRTLSLNMDSLATAWGGGKIILDRKTVKCFSIQDPRLTVSLMVQPKILQRYLDRYGDAARNIGLLARFLVFDVGTTQGDRFLMDFKKDDYGRCEFDERIFSLLESSRESLIAGGVRGVLRFDMAAQQLWKSAFNEVEAGIRPGGRYEEAGDHASKLAENYARLAACLHVFEGNEGDISIETLEIAIRICNYCSGHFMNLFSPHPEHVRDSEALAKWLLGKVTEFPRWIVPKNYILQRGPENVRTAARLNSAIGLLVEKGSVREITRYKTRYLDFRGLSVLSSVSDRVDRHNAQMRRMHSVYS